MHHRFGAIHLKICRALAQVSQRLEGPRIFRAVAMFPVWETSYIDQEEAAEAGKKKAAPLGDGARPGHF